jgi:hypothetical protein
MGVAMKIFASVLLDHPEGTDANGNMIVLAAGLERQPVEWLDPWNCEHQETMCSECVESWNQDYEIRLPDGIEE